MIKKIQISLSINTNSKYRIVIVGDSIIWIFMKEGYKEMGNLSKQINDKNGFLVKLRNENCFDEDIYNAIKDTIISDSSIWRMTGSVPLEDVVALAYLIDQLAGGSRFLDEYTADQVEDANLEILRLLDSTLFTV